MTRQEEPANMVYVLLLLVGCEPGIDSGRHGGDSWNRCLNVKTQTCIADSLGSGAAETAYHLLALYKVRSVLLEGLDTSRAEEHQHIILIQFSCSKLIAHGAVHNGLSMSYFIGIEHILEFLCMDIGHRNEILFSLMLQNGSHQAVHLSGIAKENLTLAVLNILLDVERYCLGDAEILHILRDVYSHLGAKLEEMIYSMTRCEYNSGVVKYVDVLLSELFGTKRLNANEWFEHKLNTVLISQIKIGRLACGRLRLGYENLLNFQGCEV